MFDFLADHVSYLGISLVLILSGCGLPIPEEVPVMVAGWASATGRLDIWPAFFSCLFGAIGGDVVMYAIGYHFGHGILRDHPLLARFLRPEREERVERMFQQHGLKVFFVGRFLPGLRSSVFLAAGILRVPFRTFVLFDLFCATTVVSIFFFLSHRFATQIEDMLVWIRGAGLTVSGAVAVAIVILVFFYIRRRRARLAKIRTARKERADRNGGSSEIDRLSATSESRPVDQPSAVE